MIGQVSGQFASIEFDAFPFSAAVRLPATPRGVQRSNDGFRIEWFMFPQQPFCASALLMRAKLSRCCSHRPVSRCCPTEEGTTLRIQRGRHGQLDSRMVWSDADDRSQPEGVNDRPTAAVHVSW